MNKLSLFIGMGSKNNRNILVVGGAGYIGGYLVDVLVKNNYNLLVLDNLLYEQKYLKNVPFKFADVRNYKDLKNVICHYDTIIWLAAIVGDMACEIDKAETYRVNYESVKWLCDNFDGDIIFTSTCSVYGKNNEILDEESAVNPLSTYALTKYMAEKEVAKKNRSLIFRLGTLYGIGDEHSRIRMDLVVNSMVYSAYKNKPIVVYLKQSDNKSPFRPLLNVRDVSYAILHALENKIYGLYNLAELNISIDSLAKLIANKFNNNVKIDYVFSNRDDERDYRVSVDKYKKTGWQNRYYLENTLEDLYKVFSERRIVNPEDPIYKNFLFLSSNKGTF